MPLCLYCSLPDLTALANLQRVKLNLVVGGTDQIKTLQGLSELQHRGVWGGSGRERGACGMEAHPNSMWA